MVTSRNLARSASASQAAVWAVPTSKHFVQGELRRRVLVAGEAMDCHPDEVARGLKTRRNGIIGVVIPNLHAYTWNPIIAGVEEVLAQHGYQMILRQADEDYQRENRVLDLLHRRQVEGLLVPPVGLRSKDPLLELLQAGVPLVMNTRSFPEVPADALIADERGGARALVTYLIGLGRHRTGVVAQAEWSPPAASRLAGYRGALAASGLPFDEQLVVTPRSSECYGSLLAGRLMDLPAPSDAIFAAAQCHDPRCPFPSERPGRERPEGLECRQLRRHALVPAYRSTPYLGLAASARDGGCRGGPPGPTASRPARPRATAAGAGYPLADPPPLRCVIQRPSQFSSPRYLDLVH